MSRGCREEWKASTSEVDTTFCRHVTKVWLPHALVFLYVFLPLISAWCKVGQDGRRQIKVVKTCSTQADMKHNMNNIHMALCVCVCHDMDRCDGQMSRWPLQWCARTSCSEMSLKRYPVNHVSSCITQVHSGCIRMSGTFCKASWGGGGWPFTLPQREREKIYTKQHAHELHKY